MGLLKVQFWKSFRNKFAVSWSNKNKCGQTQRHTVTLSTVYSYCKDIISPQISRGKKSEGYVWHIDKNSLNPQLRGEVLAITCTYAVYKHGAQDGVSRGELFAYYALEVSIVCTQCSKFPVRGEDVTVSL